jgi:hypothetical protein
VASAKVDGRPVDPSAIPFLADDDVTYDVTVVLGRRDVEDQHTAGSHVVEHR